MNVATESNGLNSTLFRWLASLVILMPVITAACGDETRSQGNSKPMIGTSQAIRLTEGRSIWLGISDSYGVDWSDSDLVVFEATADQPVYFSARRAAMQEFDTLWSSWRTLADSADSAACTFERSYRLLSFVGSIVSYEKSTYDYCQGTAHPNVAVEFITIDAANPDQQTSPSLRDIFDDNQILDALLGDRVVKAVLDSAGVGEAPPTLDDLIGVLTEYAGDCRYMFPDDFLQHFAFWQVDGDRVAVRIALPPGCEAARGEITQLGIWLPIPEPRHYSFQRAATQKAGVLMNDMSKLKDRPATVIGRAEGGGKG